MLAVGAFKTPSIKSASQKISTNMAPKRSETRAKAAAARQRTAIEAALDRGEGLQFSNASQVSRIGGQRATDAQGRLTPAGVIFQEVARGLGVDSSVDPWVRGTDLVGNRLFAERRSGKKFVVAKQQPDGSLIPTKKAGKEYYGAFREEMGLEIPVFLNERVGRGERGRWITASQAITLTLPQSVLERGNDAFAMLSNLPENRPDYQGPVTRLEKWRAMIEALQGFLQTVQDGVVGPFYDEFGNIMLQHIQGSESWYSFDPMLLDNYDENDESTIPEGFRLHIQTPHFPAEGQPYMQTLMQRPLGELPGFLKTPSELYNKTGMIDAAWDRRSDKRCCVRQMQVLLVKREQYTPRDDQGERRRTSEMVPEFSFQDLEKRGGLIDQAFMMCKGVEGSRHDQKRRPKSIVYEHRELLASSTVRATNYKIFEKTAKALELHLRRKGPQPLEEIKKYLNQRRKDGHEKEFANDLRAKFSRGSVYDRYKEFIKLYPDKFELQNDVVHITSSPYEWPEPVPELDVGADGPPPYEKEDWRTVGLTGELVATICKLTGHPCLVLHNTTLIYEDYPQDWDHNSRLPMICFNIWGNHGFFYSHKAANGIQNMKVKMPGAELPSEKLLQPGEEDDKVKFEDMLEYDQEAFLAAFKAKQVKVFWTKDLDKVAQDLEEAHVSHKTRWQDLGPFDRPKRAMLSMQFGKKKSTKVRALPGVAPMLDAACKLFQKRFRLRLDYTGESPGVLMLRALETALITRRMDAPKEVKEELWRAQEGMCSDCGDSLGETFEKAKYDVAHRRPRRHSIGAEGNDANNLNLKCKACHRKETEEQDMTTRCIGHTLASHPCPKVEELFKVSGKPRQQTGGIGGRQYQSVFKLDGRGSRPNGVWEYPYPLPIFSPLDEPEPCLDERGAWVQDPREWDYIWIAASSLDLGLDLEDPDDADYCMPYDGEHLYPIHVAMTLLEENVITKDHFRHGLRATRHIDPKQMKAEATKLQDCIAEVAQEHLPLLKELYPRPDKISEELYEEWLVKKQTKNAMLSMFGVFCKEERRQWTIYPTLLEDDIQASKNVRVVSGPTKGEKEIRHCCHLLDNQTYLPLGLIGLYSDSLNLRKMRRLLRDHLKEIKILGRMVDCWYFADCRSVEAQLEFGPLAASLQVLEAEKLSGPGGQSRFVLDTVPGISVPYWEVIRESKDCEEHIESFKWTVVHDSREEADRATLCDIMDEHDMIPEAMANTRDAHLPNLAAFAAKNRGACFIGPGGVGKSTILKLVEAEIRLTSDRPIILMALTHRAARLVGGVTIAHALNKHKFAHNKIAIVSEFGQLPLDMLRKLAKWKKVGWDFYFEGDPRGQLLCIYDRWGSDVDMTQLEHSSLMMSLCNFLKIEMQIYRRGEDQELFDYYFNLYQYVDDPTLVEQLVNEARDRYPYQHGEIDHALFLSDHKRCLWNALRNYHFYQENGGVLVECQKDEHGQPVELTSFSQSDMYLSVGYELIGSIRKSPAPIVNGVLYTVKEVKEKSEACPEGSVTVEMHDDYSPFAKYLQDERLRNALEGYVKEVSDLLSSAKDKARTPHALTTKASPDLLRTLNARITVGDETLRWAVFARLFPETFALDGDKVRLREDDEEADEEESIQTEVTLSHERASAWLRMTHAFCYYSVQGATLRNKHVALFDTTRKGLFTLRHLITGMSRATHGQYVHILSKGQEERLFRNLNLGV